MLNQADNPVSNSNIHIFLDNSSILYIFLPPYFILFFCHCPASFKASSVLFPDAASHFSNWPRPFCVNCCCQQGSRSLLKVRHLLSMFVSLKKPFVFPFFCFLWPAALMWLPWCSLSPLPVRARMAPWSSGRSAK